MLGSVARWVLAHKRIVASFWVLITLVGIATVGSSTKSFSKQFSVPGGEGFVTNDRIARIFHNGGNNAPLLAVVTLPAGTQSPSSPAVRGGLDQVAAKLQRAIPGSRTASFASTGDRAFVSADGRTTFVLAYPPPDSESFGTNTRAAKTAAAVLAGDRIAAAPVHADRPRCAPEPDRRQQRAGRCSSRCSAGWAPDRARLRLRIVAGFLPILMAMVAITATFLVLWGVSAFTGVSMIVESCLTDRARRRDRLLAACRPPLARGASPWD